MAKQSKSEAKQAQIIIIVPAPLKADFQTACKASGLSMTAAIRHFVRSVAAGKIIFRSGIKFKDKQ